MKQIVVALFAVLAIQSANTSSVRAGTTHVASELEASMLRRAEYPNHIHLYFPYWIGLRGMHRQSDFFTLYTVKEPYEKNCRIPLPLMRHFYKVGRAILEGKPIPTPPEGAGRASALDAGCLSIDSFNNSN